MGLKRRGAGYSIEAILASLILFLFAMNAIQVQSYEGWTDFQREIAAKDISYTLKETGDIETFLQNADTGALRTTASSLSDVDASLSGSVENLPIRELQLGFHNMPEDIHWNNTVPVDEDDYCHGDLGVIEDSSESEIRRTANGTDSLEEKFGARLYFADSDPSIPGGFDGDVNYDSIYIDNGTECIFRNEDGPYYMDDIFYWGDEENDRPGTFFEFKDYDNEDDRVNLFEADRAVRFRGTLDTPINGINTDTSVGTFNFTSGGLDDMDVVIFSGNESLDRIEAFEGDFKRYMESGSAFFLMNMTEEDVEKDVIQDIGFQWLDMPYDEQSEYRAAFSNYPVSEKIKTYFDGYGADQEQVSLHPGGKVISGQGETFTSGNDILFARNARYDTTGLNAEIGDFETWTEINVADDCKDTQTSFSFMDEDRTVQNIDLAKASSNCDEIRALRIEQDGELTDPVLENEVVEIGGVRYTPEIESNESARLVFAGSNNIELINHRRVFDDMEGERVARAGLKEEYSEVERQLLVSTIYWLRGDTVHFDGGTGTTSLSTNVYGAVNEEVYMPYRLTMRWGR